MFLGSAKCYEHGKTGSWVLEGGMVRDLARELREGVRGGDLN